MIICGVLFRRDCLDTETILNQVHHKVVHDKFVVVNQNFGIVNHRTGMAD